MTLSPPKLPLLFFEQDGIGQLDFQYRSSSRPSSTNSRTDLTPVDNNKTAPTTIKLGPEDVATSKGNNFSDNNLNDTGPATDREPSPKLFTPPMNKTLKKKKNGLGLGIEQAQTLKREDGDTSGSQETRGQSFYWHSPASGSSSENEEEDEDSEKKSNNSRPSSDTKTNETEADNTTVPPMKKPLSIKPIMTTPLSKDSLTSATIRFAGPSDWQHFTDYDAEEVDDLALYTSGKPKTAELSAGTPVEEEIEKPESAHSPRRQLTADRETLPTIQERTSELVEDSKSTDAGKEDTPEHSSTASTESRTSVGKSDSEERETSKPSVPAEPEEASKSPPNPQFNSHSDTDLADKGVKGLASEVKAIEPKTAIKMVHSEEKGTLAQQKSTKNPSIQSSGLNSPIDEDDGRERIIISLQVPDSPESDNKKETSLPTINISEEKPRERNLTVGTSLEPRIVESPDMLRTGRMSVFPQSIEMEDPYGGLDPWAKASLNRYVKLLKEEAAAQTDEKKFTLFINFMDRERRNRTALYDMDEDSENESTVQFNKVADGKGGIRSRVSLKRKAAPIIPSLDTMPIQASLVQDSDRTEQEEKKKSVSLNEPHGSETSLSNPKSTSQQPMITSLQPINGKAANGILDESFVLVDNPGEDQSQNQIKKQVKEKGSKILAERESISIKEKPVVAHVKEKQGSKTGHYYSALKKKALDLGGRSIAKDRNTTPMNLQTLLMKANDDSKKPASPIKTPQRTPPPITTTIEPEPPAPDPIAEKRDTKLMPSGKLVAARNDEAEGRAYEGDKAANRQTIYRPFSGLLRQSSVLRGSNPESKRSSVFDRKSLAAEIALSRSPPVIVSDKALEEHQKPRSQNINYRFTILEPLLLVVPQEGVMHVEPHQLAHLRHDMDAIRDDFSFIHKTVLTWDAEAKKNREHHDKERHTRTTQNEARIDALYNEREIGYSDISQLEADFKRQEATKKAEEDRQEVATFVSNVFDVVWARINYEMDQLQPLYDQCKELVSRASAGRNMFEDFEDAVPVAPSMEILLILYQKLMVRHQKAFEAVLERDRRLKKTEIAPFFALGSIEEVKNIEKRFEDAEKTAILEFCRQRDERANLLMDILDQNTLRGVGANQDYMESIMQAVRKIATEIQITGSNISEQDVVSIDEVLKAKTITSALARSSEQIVQTFHVADMLLNAADYEVSVANAKLNNADAAAFKRLREAKSKEDIKLSMDLEHRMSLIRGDTSRTQEEIVKLLALIANKDKNEEAAPRNEIERQSISTLSGQAQDRLSRIFSRGSEDNSTTAAAAAKARKIIPRK